MARRNIRIWTRLSGPEYDAFLKLLEKSTLSNSAEYVRQAVLTAQVKPPPVAEAVALLREVRAIVNNVNQIAKVANAFGSVKSDDIHELLRQHQELLALAKTLI